MSIFIHGSYSSVCYIWIWNEGYQGFYMGRTHHHIFGLRLLKAHYCGVFSLFSTCQPIKIDTFSSNKKKVGPYFTLSLITFPSIIVYLIYSTYVILIESFFLIRSFKIIFYFCQKVTFSFTLFSLHLSYFIVSYFISST